MSKSTHVDGFYALRTLVTLGFLVLVFVAGVAIGLCSGLPRRWSDPLTNLSQDQVHAVLGLPDGDFMPKGWEGWDQPVVVGAWVLLVYYDEHGQVTHTRRKFEWGFGYREWERGYKGKALFEKK